MPVRKGKGKTMTTREAAEKHASQFCISFPTSESDLKLNEEITRTISKHYLAGAAFERARILELLRSDRAREMNEEGGWTPEDWGDWIEDRLESRVFLVSIQDKESAMSDYKRLFELKQEDWFAACKEIDQLREENAKLKAKMEELGNEYAIVCHFKAENERMKSALELILNKGKASPGDKKDEIARDALAALDD